MDVAISDGISGAKFGTKTNAVKKDKKKEKEGNTRNKIVMGVA